MTAKIGFLDLDYLRVGIFLGVERIPGVPNMIAVKYRPLGFNPFKTEIIPNVLEESLLTVSNEDLGNVSTFPVWRVLVRGERGKSLFLDNILAKKYADLVEKYENLKREIEIRKGAEVSKSIQISKDLFAELERLKKVGALVGEVSKPKRPREFIRFPTAEE
jgi:hypothetical protein